MPGHRDAGQVATKGIHEEVTRFQIMLQWNLRSTNHRFDPASAGPDSSIRTFSRRAGGKWKNVLCFSKARFLHRLLHGPRWVGERPINSGERFLAAQGHPGAALYANDLLIS